jgi:hypothetical protein
MNQLDTFLTQHCRQSPDAVTTVVDFVKAFRARLLPADARRWNRTRILLDLAQRGFAIGKRGKVTFVGGVEPMRQQSWQATPDGALVLV